MIEDYCVAGANRIDGIPPPAYSANRSEIARSDAEGADVTKSLFSVVISLLCCSAVTASDPGSGRAIRQFKSRSCERQTGIPEDDFVGLVAVTPNRSIHEQLIEWAVCPVAPVLRWIEERRNSRRPFVVEERP